MSNNESILHKYAETAYLNYAVTTVKARALARVQDGLKPVHRRILYTMMSLGLNPSSKPVKCARIVGEVLGKYHPHGDFSVYDALTKMAQPFYLRYPLIEGQGNFGSRDGDGAAAMRYTEAKLSPYADLLLGELNKHVVDYVANYDNSTQEPWLTPSKLPLLLLNGTSGIAVGMAAEMPSHNITEIGKACIEVLNNENATLDDILQHIKGPDFPEGGVIINTPENLKEIYQAGRGGIKVRAKWKKEELARNQYQIVITELPFKVGTIKIMEELDKLTNPKPPTGKKIHTQQQLLLKQTALDLIDSVSDESNKDEPTRLVIRPSNSKVDSSALVNFLFENTSLEDSFPCNFTLIGFDGNPATKSLLAIIQEWIAFRKQVVIRKLQWQLEQAQTRLHIVDGRLIAYDHLDEIIKIIRTEDDPMKELVNKIGLSQVQADDILEMKLRALNNLEISKLLKEKDSLNKEINRISPILKSAEKLKKYIIDEIEQVIAKYGDNRRSELNPIVKNNIKSIKPTLKSDPIEIVLSANLWIKAYKPGAEYAFKPGDRILLTSKTNTVDNIILLSKKGRLYSINASQIPMKGDAVPLTSLLDLKDDTIIHIFDLENDDTKFLFYSSAGLGFIAPYKNLGTKLKAGKSFMDVEDGVDVLPPVKLQEGYAGCVSTENKILMFKSGDIKELANGGKGVILMNCEKLKFVKFFSVLPELFKLETKNGEIIEYTVNDSKELNKYVASRASKGSFSPNKQDVVDLLNVPDVS